MTSKASKKPSKIKWLIGVIILIIIARYLGGEYGRYEAAQEGHLTGRYLVDEIKKGCTKTPGGREVVCECAAQRMVDQIPPEELQKVFEDGAVKIKFFDIIAECVSENPK